MDKYRRDNGTVLLTGTQALVRLAVDQRRADRRRGLNTATFISGYQGSPLGMLDITLERNAALLSAHDIVWVPGIKRRSRGDGDLGQPAARLRPARSSRRNRGHVVRQRSRPRPLW